MSEPMEFDASGTLIEPHAARQRSPDGRWELGAALRSVRAHPPGSLDFGEHGRRGKALTPMEVRVLAEYVAHGTTLLAAACLGRSFQTVRNRITAIHVKTGCGTTLEALRALGWLQIPPGALSL